MVGALDRQRHEERVVVDAVMGAVGVVGPGVPGWQGLGAHETDGSHAGRRSS
jgi:hypothetical protein